jgi:hypothetical protein
MSYDSLYGFRQRAHQYLGRAHDATFELVDAVLTTRRVYSFAELSQSPLFRRQWSSVYEALQDSRPQRQRLMGLYLEQIPRDGPIVLAGDHTGWPRPEAKRLRERTHEHQADSNGSLGPVSLGQGYSTLAWIPERDGSWALPLRHERITSWESPISLAAFQLKQVCQHLPHRPLSLWDSEYSCASFVLKTADIKADKLMRLRSNRHLWGTPPPYSGWGRPRLHGDCFKLNDPTTWREAEQDLTVVHPKLGSVRVRTWQQMHFRQAAKHPMTLIQVQRLDETGQPRSTRPLWLVWVGDTRPDLEGLWQRYLRRFALEHWYRFLKQRLHWTRPKLGEPKAAERWSDLMPLATWQLWLARDIVQDSPLPWQKTLSILTPGRVADSIATLLTRLGSPAQAPKPRGKSPGWPKGQKRNRKPRYPSVRKRASRPKKASKAVA